MRVLKHPGAPWPAQATVQSTALPHSVRRAQKWCARSCRRQEPLALTRAIGRGTPRIVELCWSKTKQNKQQDRRMPASTTAWWPRQFGTPRCQKKHAVRALERRLLCPWSSGRRIAVLLELPTTVMMPERFHLLEAVVGRDSSLSTALLPARRLAVRASRFTGGWATRYGTGRTIFKVA